MTDEDFSSYTKALKEITTMREDRQSNNNNTRKTWSDIGNKQANYLSDVSAWTMENDYQNITD
jgi:hypothetical protein